MPDNEIENPKATPEEMKSEAERAAEAERESDEFESTPEVVNMIMDKVIDIQSFTGFVIRAQVPSIESILSNGIKNIYELDKKDMPKWGTQGSLINKRSGYFDPGIYLTSVGDEEAEYRWNNWSEAGQIVILLKGDNMRNKEMVMIEPIGEDDAIEIDMDKPFKDGVIDGEISGGTFRIKPGQQIEKDAIKGLVVSQRPTKLARRTDHWGKTTESITITSEQAKDILVKRLSERLKKQPDGNFAPLYDNTGNMLWPKQMSYEGVKAFVAERDAKKAAEKDSSLEAQNDTKLDSGSSPE